MSTAAEWERFYEAARNLPISRVVEALGLTVTESSEDGSTLSCDCPVHRSRSKKALSVSTERAKQPNVWHCFGCSKGGSNVDLVEFFFFGTVSTESPKPQSHAKAREWLAERFSLDIPRRLTSVSGTAAVHQKHARQMQAKRDLTRLADAFHGFLLRDEERAVAAREYLAEKWGFDLDAIKRHRIGLVPTGARFRAQLPSGTLLEALLKKLGIPEWRAEFSGMFRKGEGDQLYPVLGGRIFFPYRETFDGDEASGIATETLTVYGIGRAYPGGGTKEGAPKYMKAVVEGTEAKPTGSFLRNEVFGIETLRVPEGQSSRQSPFWDHDSIIVGEGVTDALRIIDLGIPCISPITTRFRGEDHAKLFRTLRESGISKVYFLQDNELSRVGLRASIANARAFTEAGFEARVSVLPLTERAREARALAAALLGGPAKLAEFEEAKPRERQVLIGETFGEVPKGADPEDDRHRETLSRIAEFERANDEAKVDVVEWILQAGIESGREFVEKILSPANTSDALTAAIRSIPSFEGDDRGDAEKLRAVDPILIEIGQLRPSERSGPIRELAERIDVKKTLVEKEAAALAREEKKNPSGSKSFEAPVGLDEDSDLAQQISRLEASYRRAKEPFDAELVGDLVFDWFTARGALFFRTSNGILSVFFDGETFSNATSRNPLYQAMLARHLGKTRESPVGRRIAAKMETRALDAAEVRDDIRWTHFDAANRTVYVSQGNTASRILEIAPGAVLSVPNGANDQRIVLSTDSEVRGFEFLPADPVDPDVEVEELLEEFIGRHLPMREEDRSLLILWITTVFLIESLGTRPALRFEGSAGSGKTWAAKLISVLIFGRQEQCKATDAANYVFAKRNPLVPLDNIESHHATPGLIDFILTSVTGVVRRRRDMDSEAGLAEDRPIAWVLTTGIEPLGSALEEVLSRTFAFEFDAELQEGGSGFSERAILEDLKKNRGRILSAIARRTAHILAQPDDSISIAMQAIGETLGNHSKRRCNEAIAMMLLSSAVGDARRAAREAGESPDSAEADVSSIPLALVKAIKASDQRTTQLRQGDSPFAPFFEKILQLTDRPHGSTIDLGLKFDQVAKKTKPATSGQLFIAFSKVAREYGLQMQWSSAMQIGRRLNAQAIEDLASVGILIEIGKRGGHTKAKTFTIKRVDSGSILDIETGRPIEESDGFTDVEDVAEGSE